MLQKLELMVVICKSMAQFGVVASLWEAQYQLNITWYVMMLTEWDTPKLRLPITKPNLSFML